MMETEKMETVTINKESVHVLWKPQPGKQEMALKRTEKEILYGGARFGGKSDGGRIWLLRPFVDFPDSVHQYRALILRENAKDLRGWVDKAESHYRHIGGRVVGNPPIIKFDNGAKFYIGHLADENSYKHYLGDEFHRMLIEELTLIPTELRYLKILGSCRTNCEIYPQVFCTTNPGNIGHLWVKKRWKIQGKPPYEIKTIRDGNLTRVFIPATFRDNPIGMKNDPGYEDYLNSITDEALRAAWMDGDWSKFVGQFFDINNHIHGIEAFKVPDAIDLVGSLDYGTTNPTSFGLWFQDKSNNYNYRIGEYYQANKAGSEHARDIVTYCKTHPMTDGRLPKIIYADPSMWIKVKLDDNLPAKSPADIFIEKKLNVTQANNDRINGWRILKELLHYNENKAPEMYYFKRFCKNFESLMPMQIHDEKNVEDVKKTEFDHIADETRYYSIMMRPSVSIKEMYESLESTNEPDSVGIMDRDF